MPALNDRQKVKINAALAAIHGAGHDASAVTAYAKQLQSTGQDPRSAFERAINRFIIAKPAMASEIGKITRLIEASDAATVGQYSAALDQFIQTGDKTGLQAMAPTMARDSIALALKHGEISVGDDLAASLETALGYEATPNMVAAYSTEPVEAPAASTTTEKPVEKFSFADPGTSAGQPAAPVPQGSNWSEQGFMAPKKGEALARWTGCTLAEANAAEAIG
jgi:hypothetical protein